MASPEAAARDIHRAVKRGASEVYVPWFWRPVMAVLRWLPEPVFRRLPV